MSGFRKGKFDRERAPWLLRPFTPVQAADSILEVDLDDLFKSGKRLLLLDVDNTLLEWRSEEIAEAIHKWVDDAQALGFQLCILSNTRNPERLGRLAKALGIEYLLGRFKPSRQMFHQALKKFAIEAEDAVMIGDQMFTDVWGANRSGIDAILVRQMAPHEFLGTKMISRVGERIVRRGIHRAFQEHPEEMPLGGAAAIAMMGDPAVVQFIKFCIVGGTSTVVDLGLHYLLMFVIPWQGGLLSQTLGQWLLDHGGPIFQQFATRSDGTIFIANAASPIFKVFTAGIAIFNSFVWNRSWTFKIKSRENRAAQLRKFYAVALIGLGLNTVLLTLMSNIIPGHEKQSWAIASVIAMVVVAFWNFFGQRFWTFRQRHTEPE